MRLHNKTNEERNWTVLFLHLHRALNNVTRSSNQHMHTFNYY